MQVKKKSEGNAITLVLQNHGEWRNCFKIMVAVVQNEQIS